VSWDEDSTEVRTANCRREEKEREECLYPERIPFKYLFSGMRGNADRNASLVIGQRLSVRYQKSQEKPSTPLARERVSKDAGVVVSQDAQSAKRNHLFLS